MRRIVGLFLIVGLLTNGTLAAQDTARLRWTELPQLLVAHDVRVSLASGARLEGMVLSMNEDGVNLIVRKTSDRKAHPKGQATIQKADVSVIEMIQFANGGRVVGTVVGSLGGLVAASFAAVSAADASDSGGLGLAAFLGVLGGSILGCYYLGKKADRKITRIAIIP